jgi:hypothetical protein
MLRTKILVYLALAATNGLSHFTVREVTSHAQNGDVADRAVAAGTLFGRVP